MAALIEAGQLESGQRLALEARARQAVQTWSQLERAHEQAEKTYDRDAQRAISGRMEQFAKDLKRDPHLDSVLRQRGRALGMAEGSRLELVVQSQGLDRALMRQLGLRPPSQGLGMGR